MVFISRVDSSLKTYKKHENIVYHRVHSKKSEEESGRENERRTREKIRLYDWTLPCSLSSSWFRSRVLDHQMTAPHLKRSMRVRPRRAMPGLPIRTSCKLMESPSTTDEADQGHGLKLHMKSHIPWGYLLIDLPQTQLLFEPSPPVATSSIINSYYANDAESRIPIHCFGARCGPSRYCHEICSTITLLHSFHSKQRIIA